MTIGVTIESGLFLFINPETGKIMRGCPKLGDNFIQISWRVFQTTRISSDVEKFYI